MRFYNAAKRGLKLYLMFDFLMGPLIVGVAFAGFAAFIVGTFAAWYLGVPWLLAMVGVGAAWVGLGWGAWLALRKIWRWVL